MPESLSPLSEAKAQLSLKSIELGKHYKKELKTLEAELSALNDKKQLLEAKVQTVRYKIKEIAHQTLDLKSERAVYFVIIRFDTLQRQLEMYDLELLSSLNVRLSFFSRCRVTISQTHQLQWAKEGTKQ